jgi:hypothetical protein
LTRVPEHHSNIGFGKIVIFSQQWFALGAGKSAGTAITQVQGRWVAALAYRSRAARANSNCSALNVTISICAR